MLRQATGHFMNQSYSCTFIILFCFGNISNPLLLSAVELCLRWTAKRKFKNNLWIPWGKGKYICSFPFCIFLFPNFTLDLKLVCSNGKTSLVTSSWSWCKTRMFMELLQHPHPTSFFFPKENRANLLKILGMYSSPWDILTYCWCWKKINLYFKKEHGFECWEAGFCYTVHTVLAITTNLYKQEEIH